MKTTIYIGATAALALVMTLPLSADALPGAVDGSSEGVSIVAKTGANLTPTVRPATAVDSRLRKASQVGSLAADGNADPEALRRPEERVHLSYRSFARRLNKVEADVVDQAKRNERWTREEVQEHRERINKIRARFRDKADKRGAKLSKAETARFEADVKALESAAAKARD